MSFISSFCAFSFTSISCSFNLASLLSFPLSQTPAAELSNDQSASYSPFHCPTLSVAALFLSLYPLFLSLSLPTVVSPSPVLFHAVLFLSVFLTLPSLSVLSPPPNPSVSSPFHAPNASSSVQGLPDA